MHWKVLNSKDIDAIFADVLIIMGKATKSHHYLYEHDPSTNLIPAEIQMENYNTLTETILIYRIYLYFFEELLPPFIKQQNIWGYGQ
jgi:hypothetical protein